MEDYHEQKVVDRRQHGAGTPLASTPVQAAAPNIFQKQDYSKRSNAQLNVRGVKGTNDKAYSRGTMKWHGYKSTQGTNKGASWATAFFLPDKNITSNNNPSRKNTSYFATNAPQGFTMDPQGNMYFAFSRRNSNGASTGYLYNGYIMRVDAYAVSVLKKNPHMLRTNPQSLIRSNHIRFSNMDWAFCSGSLAYDPATKSLKFLVAYSKGGAFLKTHPVQMAQVNPNSLKRVGTAKFFMHDVVTGQYLAHNLLAFDNQGNFYTGAATSLNTTHGDAYIIIRGQRHGNSYTAVQQGMALKPTLNHQLQGMSVDGNRLYLTSNSAYMSINLTNYLRYANVPSKAASANSWIGLEVNRISGNREWENVVGHAGQKYAALAWPNEVLVNGKAKKAFRKNVVTVKYHPGYGIAIWTKPTAGRKPVKRNGKNVTLKHGTAWKFFKTQKVGNVTWYNLGGNQWLEGKYLVVG